MIDLRDNENILMTSHKHWFIFAGHMVVIGFFAFFPVFAAFSLDFIRPFPPTIVIFFSSLWWLVLILIFYLEWLVYILDSVVVTNQRLFFIEQHGLFKREVTEFEISRVQDITIETPGFFGSLFNFGTLTVQTAGETNFTIDSIPDLITLKNCIMSAADKKAGEMAELHNLR